MWRENNGKNDITDIYRRYKKWHLIDNYIYFYNHQRIQLKTGEAPLTLRLSA